MKTVVSKTGIDILYPCSVHLLTNGAVVECEYKSDQYGKDIMNYICDYLSLEETEYWGLRYVDVHEQRYWLDLNNLIRPQIKNSCSTHFHFRVKVYPPEPYKLKDEEAKYQIFMQLRFDLMSGRLGCGPSDSATLIGLILQYTYGDYDHTVHIGNYVHERILLNQTLNIEMRAIDMHKNHLNGLSIDQAQDLFLRMAGQLETYGVDPYLVEDIYGDKLTLWINYRGIATYVQGKEVHRFDWSSISDLVQKENKLELHFVSEDVVVFCCFTTGECDYILQGAMSHYVYFTKLGVRSKSVSERNSCDSDDEEAHENVEHLESYCRSDMKKQAFLVQKYNEAKLTVYYPCRRFCYNVRYIVFVLIIFSLVKLLYFSNVDIFENLSRYILIHNHLTFWS